MALSWVIPWQDSVKRGAVLDHATVEPVVARTAGFLRELYVHDGDTGARGPAARAVGESGSRRPRPTNSSARRRRTTVQRRAALSEPLDAVRQTASAYTRLAEETRIQSDLRQWQLDECILRAPRDGVIRQEDLDKLIGQYFPRGRQFCEVGSANEFRAIISLDESEARRVTVGQMAYLRLRALSGRTYEGRIISAPVSSLTRLTTMPRRTSTAATCRRRSTARAIWSPASPITKPK